MCTRHIDSTNPGRSNLVFRSDRSRKLRCRIGREYWNSTGQWDIWYLQLWLKLCSYTFTDWGPVLCSAGLPCATRHQWLSSLRTDWGYLHSGCLHWMVEIAESFPVDSIGIRRVISAEVSTVEVGGVTGLIPPGTVKEFCTVRCIVSVVIGVNCGELCSPMTPKTVTWFKKTIENRKHTNTPHF